MHRHRLPIVALLLSVSVVSAACSDEDEPTKTDPTATTASSADSGTITVYSGRDEEFVGSLFEDFTAATGIDVEPRYGDSAELAATILEEGDASPADVFFAQDAGSLGAVADGGLFAPIDPVVVERVEARFRSDDGLWVGTSGRGRVAVYNTDALSGGDLPDSILDFADPAWKGRIGLPPTNSSFQAHVAAMIEMQGEDATRAWLEALMANDPVFYEDNGATTRAVGAGEVEVGLVNHYYKYEVEAEDGARRSRTTTSRRAIRARSSTRRGRHPRERRQPRGRRGIRRLPDRRAGTDLGVAGQLGVPGGRGLRAVGRHLAPVEVPGA